MNGKRARMLRSTVIEKEILVPTARRVVLRCPNGHRLAPRQVVVGGELDQICNRCGESARIKVELGEDGHTVVIDG